SVTAAPYTGAARPADRHPRGGGTATDVRYHVRTGSAPRIQTATAGVPHASGRDLIRPRSRRHATPTSTHLDLSASVARSAADPCALLRCRLEDCMAEDLARNVSFYRECCGTRSRSVAKVPSGRRARHSAVRCCRYVVDHGGGNSLAGSGRLTHHDQRPS